MVEGQRYSSVSSLEFVGLLGEGAFGKVYLVKKYFLNGKYPKQFALKVFHHKNLENVMQAEAEAMFEVRSKHCVVVYGFEEVNGSKGLLMELIEGITLDELAKKHKLNDAEILAIVWQIYLGLRDLFSKGLLHGDLSPKNVMIDTQGRVVLVDFGLTKVFRGDTVAGNPNYLSPSRLAGGVPNQYDDLWALKHIEFDLRNNLVGRRRSTAKIDYDSPNELVETLVPESLMDKVKDVLNNRSVSSTVVYKKPFSEVKRYRFIAILLLGAILLGASGSQTSNTRLSLRSPYWMRLQFSNGLELKNTDQFLDVRYGRHWVKWQTAKKSGEREINLHRNNVVLSENDFN